ncbi:hypothetical protein [Bordetella bronchialis]|uniref:Uncharacterized protein n=1 Tax=Bordetella bronchialis TaxID=463025 RepID=A0A193FUP2_9BORD|nr:hypothetical protein [Bordetella bronchialis]ANN70901.1 hypothetical protein BAU08_05765 [Bordetella bronchialis]
MLDVKITSNMKDVMRRIDAFTARQLPFALAQGINTTAARVQAAETENIKATFKNPTPFTQKSVGVSKARKSSPVATIYVKKIAAAYLQPYEDGGVHKLNSRALLNPKDIRLNSYGQLPRSALGRLKARPDVFIGAIRARGGQSVNGVWQRVAPKRGRGAGKATGRRGVNQAALAQQNPRGRLKLLIRFGDALPVNKQLNFGATAREIVDRYFPSDFEAALAEALRTAR